MKKTVCFVHACDPGLAVCVYASLSHQDQYSVHTGVRCCSCEYCVEEHSNSYSIAVSKINRIAQSLTNSLYGE